MCEKVVLKEGIMKNPQMTNYILPTTVDIPDMKIDFLPTYWEGGAYGCKGVGELPMDETAAIIGRAVGVIGSNRAYLEQLAAQLHALAIPDDYVDALLQRLPPVGAASLDSMPGR